MCVCVCVFLDLIHMTADQIMHECVLEYVFASVFVWVRSVVRAHT